MFPLCYFGTTTSCDGNHLAQRCLDNDSTRYVLITSSEAMPVLPKGVEGGERGAGHTAHDRRSSSSSAGRWAGAVTAEAVVVDDATVFRFNEVSGVAPGVKLPLSSSAACLPEDWNRFEVRNAGTGAHSCVSRER